jgi:hypothetical protein
VAESQVVHVRIEAEVLEKISAAARRDRRSTPKMIEKILVEWLEAQQNPGKETK